LVRDPDQRNRIVERFVRDHPTLAPEDDISGVLDYLDFADAYQVLRQNSTDLRAEYEEELRRRGETLAKLANIRNRVMHSRPLLAGDFETVYAFVTDVANAGTMEWPATLQALTKLSADPSFVLGLSLPSLSSDDSPVYHNLPAPDFDETGFIGRSDDAQEIRKLLLGPNTVVSVIGEGGIGKTALLLKVLYDIVDMGEQCPFDAIIWCSAKTTVLTPSGIQAIRDAVCDMPGVAQGIGEVLGVPEQRTDNQLKEIIEYFREFRVLLALDNLETVVGSELRHFIREAQLHCKLAITSRIGLGELEFRWHLKQMRKREAGALFRAHAKIRNIQDLVRMAEKRLVRILDQLHYNPLAIKWFVHSVQAGKSPDEVVSEKQSLLDYCMSNVYAQLRPAAQAVLNAALAARGDTSEAELIYYSELSALEVREVLNELLATSFLERTTRNKGAAEEVVYSTNDFAREYLLKRHAPGRRVVEQVQRKRNQLMGSVQDAKRIGALDEFSVNALVPRNRSERAACPLLRQALSLSRKRRYAEAMGKLDEARAILPQYFEIYRVGAFLKASSDDLLGAEEDYKIALDLEPANARLLYFYAGFLVRHMQDAALALPYAEQAYSLRPESVETATLFARCTGYAGDYPKALELLHHILDSEASAAPKSKKVVTTLLMDFHRRQSEDERTVRKDYDRATVSVQTGLAAFDSAVSEGYIDDRIMQELADLLQEYGAVMRHVRSPEEQAIYKAAVSERSEYLVEAGREDLVVRVHAGGVQTSRPREIDIRIGKVIERYPDRLYAFVECQQGERFFFHQNHLSDVNDWIALHNDSLVRFQVGSNAKGACATNLEVIDKYEHTQREEGGPSNSWGDSGGMVIEYHPPRPFAFIQTDAGPRYFFHRSAVVGRTRWHELANGAPVLFRLGRNEQGICAMDVTLRDEIPGKEGRSPKRVGKVVEHHRGRAYAFLQCLDGSRFFFHRSNLVESSDWQAVRNGLFATFELGQNKAGVCADVVEPLAPDEKADRSG